MKKHARKGTGHTEGEISTGKKKSSLLEHERWKESGQFVNGLHPIVSSVLAEVAKWAAGREKSTIEQEPQVVGGKKLTWYMRKRQARRGVPGQEGWCAQHGQRSQQEQGGWSGEVKTIRTRKGIILKGTVENVTHWAPKEAKAACRFK